MALGGVTAAHADGLTVSRSDRETPLVVISKADLEDPTEPTTTQ